MATEIDDFHRGDTVVLTLAIGVDMTGGAIFFTMKSDADMTDAAAEVAVTGVLGAVGGNPAYPTEIRTATITIPHATTKTLEVRSYFSDTEIVQAGDIVATILSQKIGVLKDITIRIA